MRRESVITLVLVGAIGFSFAAPAALPAEGRRQAIEYLAQGQALERNGNLPEAAEALEKSIALAPSPAGYCLLGRVYARMGRKADARAALEKALELNPNYELAKLELARLGVRLSASTEVGGEQNSAEDYDGARNVDALQAEVETIHSLRKPEISPDDATPEPRPLIGRVGLLLPQAPIPKGSGKPTLAPAPRKAPPLGGVRDQVIPQEPVEIVYDVPPRQIETTGGASGQARTKKTKTASTRDASVTGPGNRDKSSPENADSPVQASSPMVESTGGSQNPAPVGGGKLSPGVINRVAFSEEARAEKGSIGYGNTNKVVLGTFAFHREKGDSYRKAERWVEAANEYEQALRLNPNDVETRSLLAEALARAGEQDAAEAQFDRAISIAPDDARVYYRRGNVYRVLRRLNLAVGDYRKAIALDPKNKFAYNNLGVVYMEKGEYAKAAEQFKKVLELDPKYDKAILNLGIIYDDHLRDKAQALRYYELYLKLGGNRADEVRRWADSLRSELQEARK